MNRFQLNARARVLADHEFIAYDPDTRQEIPYEREGDWLIVDDAYEQSFCVMFLHVPASIAANPEALMLFRRLALKGY